MKRNKIKFIPPKMHVKVDDIVYILSGKDKGKKGKVLKAIPKKGQIVVEGVNMTTRHMKPSQNSAGGKLTLPAPIYSCKAMLYSETHGVRSRTGKRLKEDGTKVRYLKKIDEIV